MRAFIYLGDRVTAGGGCEAGMTARTKLYETLCILVTGCQQVEDVRLV